jgi:hypothetical protein
MVIIISILNGDNPLNETVKKSHNLSMPVLSFYVLVMFTIIFHFPLHGVKAMPHRMAGWRIKRRDDINE